MKKEEALEACIKHQKKNIEDLEKSLERVRQCAREAPGHNVSHSDTSKFQYSNLGLGIEKRYIEAKKALNLLEISFNDFSKRFTVIRVGSLFGLRDIGSGEINYYLLIPVGGGYKFEVDGKIVISISNKAPLARLTIGKEEGDEIEFREKTFEIVGMQ